MKVVQINCTYEYGSTGKITKDLDVALKQHGFESWILYGRRQSSAQKNVIKTCSEIEAKFFNILSRFTGKPYKCSPFGTNYLIRKLKKIKPDIVHLQCINGFFVDIYQLLAYLKKEKIKTVITLHAEFMYTGNCAHAILCEQWKTGCKKCPDKKQALNSYVFAPVLSNWVQMKNAFEGFEAIAICSVSEWVTMRAQQSEILNQYPIVTIFNGIDTANFFYNQEDANKLRKDLQLLNKKIILHVTANYRNPAKGGSYITKLSTQLDSRKYVLIVVDGNENAPPEDFQGIYWGRAKNQKELATLYTMADVVTITSRRECLPTTCVEALCCGTPIVCFDFHDGFGEPSFPNKYAKIVPFGKLDELKKEVEIMCSKQMNKEEISNECRNIFSCEKMTQNYIQVYKSLGNVEGG